jgi:hypothetical protein
MQAITTIGLDIAKSVFQAHGVDAAGQVVVRRAMFSRSFRCGHHCLHKPWNSVCARLELSERKAGRD